MRDIQIFCDFDGTITKEDTLNKFLRVYADKKWLELEEAWVNGKIGSRECTAKQMKLVPALEEQEIISFIDSIEIDEHFKPFIEYVKQNNIDFCIVSDGFDLFIKSILKRNGIENIKVFSNHLRIENGKYICEFPYTNPDCKMGAGMCKCNIVKKYKNVTNPVLYVGDGVSDFCISNNISTVFAKAKLLEYCKKNNREEREVVEFRNFKEILEYLKKS